MPRRISTVVLVGRPNVGKSTLFNKITGSRRAIVTSIAGTTRDWLSRPSDWQGTRFHLIDTGGLYGASEDPLHELVVRQGRRAIGEADLLVMLVDGREGLVAADETIARELHEADRPVIVAVNKIDDKRARHVAPEFYKLGFATVVEISAEHGTGVDDLLDEIVRRLPNSHQPPAVGPDAPSSNARGAPTARARAAAVEGSLPAPKRGYRPSARSGRAEPVEARVGGPASSHEPALPSPKVPTPTETTIAIIGRQNVGKSSLLNRLLRRERVMVSETPGTTRDAIDAELVWHHHRFRVVDTAGMRRPGRVRDGGTVELVSVAGAKRAIFEADVVALIIDASTGATDLDAAIGGEADRAGRGVVIVANKWDLVKDRGPGFSKTFDEDTRERMRFLDYAPLLHVSALTGERASKVLETIDKIARTRRTRVSTPALNKFVAEVTAENPPVSPGRKHVRILYVAQVGAAPPSFVFFTNVATQFHFSYERFLVNKLREHFGFVGTPIRLKVRRRAKG